MKLTNFRIINFKGFKDSGQIKFSQGFNFVVGQNNAGKTAFLEALAVRFAPNPHRSVATKPTPTSVVSNTSRADFSVEVTGPELRELLLAGTQFYISIPSNLSDLSKNNAIGLLEDILKRQTIELQLRYQVPSPGLQAAIFPSYGGYVVREYSAIFNPIRDTLTFDFSQIVGGNPGPNQELGARVAEAYQQRIYAFRAERMNVGECAYGTNSTLATNAQNLPEVLNFLQSNPVRFNRFNKAVSQIFPTIQHVSVRPKQQNSQLEILIWTTDPNLEREDLAIGLADSGTGVGQVLAILYVAITSLASRTIVIDEPNSFLHPGAARKLMEILQQFSDQQYIISTHSADIIGAVKPSTLSILRWDDAQSKIEQLDVNSVLSLKAVLREVGVRLSDVFGADRILWVEGSTEEDCFKLIVERFLKRLLAGISIVAVRDTGSFDAKKPSAKAIWEIYEKLSQGRALLPPAVAFSFDQDGRTPQQIKDLVKQSGGRVQFLPRRMYENYLLDVDAISSVFGRLPGIQNIAFNPKTFENWIGAHFRDFLPPEERSKEFKCAEWFNSVDGAALLQSMFSDISESRAVYRKAIHGYMLTEWLIDNKPDNLRELADYISSLLDS